MKKILVIEDDKVDQMAFERFVKAGSLPFAYQMTNSIKAAREALEMNDFDAILSDYFLGEGTAFDILSQHPDIPVVVVTGTGSEEIAVNALKKGAYDYLIKDVEGSYLTMIPITLKNAIRRFKNEKELQEYHAHLEQLVESRTAELTKALEKATESDRLKTAFLQNISHEIRTPMNGILGFAGLLKDPGLSSKDQQDYIRIIEKSGARMLNTINQLMDISKIETGQMDVVLSKISVNQMMEEVVRFFKPEAAQKGVRLSYKDKLTKQKDPLETDNEKLHTILSNLVKNAIKFTHQGSIELGCKAVETNQEPFVQFYVKDTGIGVPKKKQKVVFDRFIHADIEDKMAYQGTGLGLSISKAYVEILGGKIWVESQQGKGSVFYFTLPAFGVEHFETTYEEGFSKPDTTSEKLKIMVVEDDDLSERFLTTIIKSLSKETLVARTANEALEFYRQNPDIDLIFMDIGLPDMNGYAVTKEIRKLNKKVVIIAETAFAFSGDREKAMAAGCDDYISKPIIKEELMILVKNHFKPLNSK